jgi:2-keto-4-pentenoate hydratase/2-oxohepta-3-ene-1,7-dioic acid hydratase in catechol pathway
MFRLINVDGRAALHRGDHWYDLATLSGDPSLAEPMVAVARHGELSALHERCEGVESGGSVADATLGPPVPRPGQVFGIGLNYRDHAGESGMELPSVPLVFTKFPSCIAGPTSTVPLSGELVDWEVEIVAVVGREASRVSPDDAWDVLAGLTLGQDISDRAVQLSDQPPQFSMGKSFPAFGPIGPAIVPIDAFADRDDIGLWCELDGERMQDGRTSDLIFSIPVLIAYLSSICTLQPGDLVFTGTPPGVGMARGRFLAPGELITSGAEVIGELANRCVPGVGAISPT